MVLFDPREWWEYKILVKILREGPNLHKTVRTKKLPHTQKFDGDDTEYEITADGLWKIKKSILFHLFNKMLFYRGHYLILFKEGNGEPVTHVDSKVTPKILKKVKGSTILGKAFAELFKGTFGGMKRIGFILFMIVSITVVYAYMRGWIG